VEGPHVVAFAVPIAKHPKEDLYVYYPPFRDGHIGREQSLMVKPALTASLVAATLAALANSPTPASERIEVAEMTVESVQEGLRSHRFTARQLAEASLARIATYNPGYNAIITPNPDALRDADDIDRRRASGETLGPLAGVPVVVKDTMDVAGLPTTAGWAPLSSRAGGVDLIPEFDSPVVERLRRAGAVILGKTNVPVFSGSAENANDSWAGPTLNAAAPARAPGGSSAGTATAIAASFAVLGLGEETGGSIQYPAAWQALVGVKPTFGLVPNTGVVPLGGSTRDVVGPIARTVRDAAIGLDVLAGYTPADPKTVAAIGHVTASGYAAGLTGATLRGKRIGLYGPGWLAIPLSDETRRLYRKVAAELRREGAIVVADPFAGSEFASLARPTGAWRYDQRGEESVAFDLENYLARLGQKAAARSVAGLVAIAGQDPFAEGGPLAYERASPTFLASLAAPSRVPDLRGFLDVRQRYIATFDAMMDRQNLDALVLPQTVAEAPLLHSDEIIDSPTVSQINIGGFPGIIVPAGYYASGTPFGVIFVGRLWDEARLLKLAYAYEQHTRLRRAPVLVPHPAESGGDRVKETGLEISR
jgi:aspartyl-tRNA(Asn)/glutamyl-tRNA(Gln) amidotransferase subunit A